MQKQVNKQKNRRHCESFELRKINKNERVQSRIGIFFVSLSVLIRVAFC